ncbi:cyclase family protein [Rhodoplanes sp. Z2-YC6860]|uniref:cyclase family protein n=1 Tax=Rhodoplanes sp. Z2-YC6860 TaxID=674703 RepID=UPI00078CD89C|nr:cyclase family protein [Rhodoplanes sp. Z2-YC6860]AMN43864.1 cyclase family protein [Rhodoplanes sp. Z2-YC6860]
MSRIVDLTLPVTSNMAGIPKIAFYEQNPTRVQAVTVVSEEQRATLTAERVDLLPDAPITNSMNTVFTLNTHIGTHIDAPRHFYADGYSVTDLPLDRIVMREAVVIDVSHKKPGEGVTGDDLERTGVKPAPGQIAVIKTLWTNRAFGKPEFWAQTIHLEPSVGEWVERQGVSAVAMDCFPEKPFWLMTLTPAERGANHKRWLKAGIPMIQMLTALDRIAPRFMLTALPLKLQGMDGAPARVIGIEP